MKKVLVVSLRAGAGHVMAAEALEHELVKNYPDIQTENIDMLDHVSILSKEFYGKWYIDMVNAVPQFYGWLYDNIKPNTTDFRLISDRINAQDFQKFVFNYDPDLIIATNFVPANLLTYWRKEYRKKYKIAITVTDYEAHPLWVDKEIDKYYVANLDVKDQLVNLGVDSNKIATHGIPINEKYSKVLNQQKIRQNLKLKDQFTILIASGGFGMGPIPKIINKLNKISESINILVMTGKNNTLYQSLVKTNNNMGHKILLYKFINNDQELMAASDVIVGKPGGLTVSESLTVGRPIIIIDPIPGQEVANANFLMRNLAGIKADNEDELIVIIQHLIKNKEIILELQKNTQRISHPDAASAIVKDVIQLLD